jgi:serine/threonine-protein kinase
MKDLCGQTLAGRYEIRERLTEHLLWTSYRAYDHRQAVTVVLKLLREDLAASAEFIRRFRDRLAILRDIEHESIQGFQGFEQTRDHAFLIMEDAPDLSLEKYLREKRALTREMALAILRPLAAALQFAHRQGIHHGDIRSGNILLRADGLALLADFGLLVWASASAPFPLAAAEYIAPEQAQGALGDPRSDLYALARVFYKALTGSLPAADGASAEPPELPGAFRAALRRALSQDPARRQKSVAEFYSQLAGEPLADAYPPDAKLAAWIAAIAGESAVRQGKAASAMPASSSNLKQAAARLAAFLAKDKPAAPESKTTEVAPRSSIADVLQAVVQPPPKSPAETVPAPAKPPETSPVKPAPEPPPPETPSPMDEEYMRFVNELRQEAASAEPLRHAGTLLQRAGIEFLYGHWSRARAICAVILEMDPKHLAAQVLASEAITAQFTEQLYASAKDALEKGETDRAAELLRQILSTDRAHEEARNLLRKLKGREDDLKDKK